MPSSLSPASTPSFPLDCSKARERLGWRPAYDFDEGLAETVRWYEKFLSGGFSRRGWQSRVCRYAVESGFGHRLGGEEAGVGF